MQRLTTGSTVLRRPPAPDATTRTAGRLRNSITASSLIWTNITMRVARLATAVTTTRNIRASDATSIKRIEYAQDTREKGFRTLATASCVIGTRTNASDSRHRPSTATSARPDNRAAEERFRQNVRLFAAKSRAASPRLKNPPDETTEILERFPPSDRRVPI